MYDGIATLKGNPTVTYDTYGNEVITYTDNQVYVIPRGVYSSEFYNAAQVGLQPSIVLTITNRADYNGEKLVEYEGVLYDIIRVDWTAQRDRISLTLVERIGDGESDAEISGTTAGSNPDGVHGGSQNGNGEGGSQSQSENGSETEDNVSA